MSSETTGAQDRPARSESNDDRGADATPPRERDDGKRTIGTVNAEPGARRTTDVANLKIEAKMVADGHEPDNPWVPVAGSGAAEDFAEWAEDKEYEPAWMRPWEDDDE